jgi:hypothetical protein
MKQLEIFKANDRWRKCYIARDSKELRFRSKTMGGLAKAIIETIVLNKSHHDEFIRNGRIAIIFPARSGISVSFWSTSWASLYEPLSKQQRHKFLRKIRKHLEQTMHEKRLAKMEKEN